MPSNRHWLPGSLGGAVGGDSAQGAVGAASLGCSTPPEPSEGRSRQSWAGKEYGWGVCVCVYGVTRLCDSTLRQCKGSRLLGF